MTTRRILLPEAGTGAANNLIRSLRADYSGATIVGVNSDRFTLRNSKANRNYLLAGPRRLDGLREIIEREQIDLLIPITDADVALASRHREALPCRLFLPSAPVIERCGDGYELARFLASHQVPVAATLPITDLDALDSLFARIGPCPRLWCQVRSGRGACRAAAVDSPDDARAWIAYRRRMGGAPAIRFTLSEYLPGRDFVCQSLWKDGRLVLVKTVERLARPDAETRVGGTPPLASLAKTVNDARMVEICTRAIRALDPCASGAFGVELKESASGEPRVTEIRAGRFMAMLNFFDMTGTHNMSATYVRLALEEPVEVVDAYDVAEDRYFVCGVDTLPAIFTGDELLEGIHAIDGVVPRSA